MRQFATTILFFVILGVAAPAAASDNTLRVFPTYAVAGPGSVTVPVHAWVFEHENDLLRRAAIKPLESLLDIEDDTKAEAIFERRMLDFLVDNERGEDVFVTLRGPGVAPVERKLGETPANGHLKGSITAPFEPIPGAVNYRFELAVRVEDGPSIVLQVPLIEATGVSVVSDIDDTIKITNVLDKKELLANSFTREFRQAPGMSEFFERLRKAHSPRFHYLSASPWNLYGELDSWRRRDGFPDAVWHLRIFRAKDFERTVKFLEGSEGHKVRELELLFKLFPKRTFILVGDSGEKDPEIYGRVAQNFPDSVQHIYIREVPGAKNDSARFDAAFDGIDASNWTTFADPKGLPK